VGRKSPLMAVIFSCGVLLAAAVGLASCGSQIAIEPSAQQSTTTGVSQASTTIATLSDATADVPTEGQTTTTSTEPTTPTTFAGITTSSSLPVIELMGDPKLDYLHPEYSYKLADAVVLATVVQVLPFRQNPVAYQPDDPDGAEHQPVVYKGYVLSVERAFGPDTIPATITVFALGNGTVVVDGVTYEVRNDLPLDAGVGERLLLPLTKDRYYGTPEPKEDEYWVQAPWAVFSVDANDRCMRVTGREFSEERRAENEYSLSFLEDVAVAQSKNPSVIQ
jgi:hypothetical protein